MWTVNRIPDSKSLRGVAFKRNEAGHSDDSGGWERAGGATLRNRPQRAGWIEFGDRRTQLPSPRADNYEDAAANDARSAPGAPQLAAADHVDRGAADVLRPALGVPGELGRGQALRQGHGGIGRGRAAAPCAQGLLALALLATGCTGCASGLRGDGTLAVLEISDKLHDLRYAASSITAGGRTRYEDAGDMVDAFCAGAHLWDVVDAQVRCLREVEGQPAASKIGVVLADGWENPGAAMWWSTIDDKIHVAHMIWGEADGAAAAAAHEIGHAMGLGHLGGYDLMHTEIRSNTLTIDDKAAFRAMWTHASPQQ